MSWREHVGTSALKKWTCILLHTGSSPPDSLEQGTWINFPQSCSLAGNRKLKLHRDVPMREYDQKWFITIMGCGLHPLATVLQYVVTSKWSLAVLSSHLGDSRVYLVRNIYSSIWVVFVCIWGGFWPSFQQGVRWQLWILPAVRHHLEWVFEFLIQ